MTFGMHGGFIKIGLGSETTHAELMNDWMLTHEMIHLAFPSVADEHHWIEEGISTYVEPIARIRISNMKEEQMWTDLIRDMPKGQPREGDEGLDNTHTWGRTYWGGALFVSMPTWKSAARRKTKKACRTPCAASSTPAATSPTTGTWLKLSKSATKPLASRFSPISTTK